MLFIASDHGGFDLKNELIKYLHEKQISVFDMGPTTLNENDDYPDYVFPLAKRVTEDLINNKGIVVCRNGVGVSMLANKINGIRAGISWSPDHAKTSREDDNTNVLALPADFIDLDTAKKTLDVWLNTNFSSELRHKRRLDKISEIEKKLQ